MQFPKEHFQIILFHYDNVVDEWDQFEWNDRVIHVQSTGQSKWLDGLATPVNQLLLVHITLSPSFFKSKKMGLFEVIELRIWIQVCECNPLDTGFGHAGGLQRGFFILMWLHPTSMYLCGTKTWAWKILTPWSKFTDTPFLSAYCWVLLKVTKLK